MFFFFFGGGGGGVRERETGATLDYLIEVYYGYSVRTRPSV